MQNIKLYNRIAALKKIKADLVNNKNLILENLQKNMTDLSLEQLQDKLNKTIHNIGIVDKHLVEAEKNRNWHEAVNRVEKPAVGVKIQYVNKKGKFISMFFESYAKANKLKAELKRKNIKFEVK